MENKNMDKQQINELIVATGFDSGEKAKGTRALLHTLHYIFGVEIEDHAAAEQMLESMTNPGGKIPITQYIEQQQMFEISQILLNKLDI